MVLLGEKKNKASEENIKLLPPAELGIFIGWHFEGSKHRESQ